MNKNQAKSTALQEKVLQTALILFSEQGYFNTSIQDIKRKAGVSTGAIYHHFQNKEHLAKLLYQNLINRIENEMAPIVSQHTNCFDCCYQIIEYLFQLTHNEPQMMQFILLAKHKEYLPDEVPICSSTPFIMMRQILENGIKNGEVRDIEPWVAATAMFGGALRMMNLSLDGALDKPLSDYLNDMVECGWRAVKTD